MNDKIKKTPSDAPYTQLKRVDPISLHDFLVVGIGASAGGLAAFEAFFSGISDTIADLNMAFILVQHLAPEHESILSELIQRYTQMSVFEATDGTKIEPNCVYTIPPNHDMALIDGALKLLVPSAPHGHRLPIDFFFQSLASQMHERAVGIILSGTGSDGSMGFRAIKSEGGMLIAQTPASSGYDGMPRNAIATGLVDYQLPPEKMMDQLIAYSTHCTKNYFDSEVSLLSNDETLLNTIFTLISYQMGHDFSQYKQATVQRRIERRMAVHQIEGVKEYVQFMQKTPVEVEELFYDILIGVTHFFRDEKAFSALENKVIQQLIASKAHGSTLRIWVPGCSTGEEAYSLAILFYEHMERAKKSIRIQIFATDIDARAIATARAGIYPVSISLHITQERLERFFVPEPHNSSVPTSAYRVGRTIRDILIFSEQDVIKDPPFSKLDLISCRNLLIYFGPTLQQALFHVFHYALHPDGFLFLGTSETVGSHSNLFAIVDNKAKIFHRKAHIDGNQKATLQALISPVTRKGNEQSQYNKNQLKQPAKPSLREITETALLKEIYSAGILINGDGDILYLHGRTGLYLEPTEGVSGVNNILKMAREGLNHTVTIALHQARRTHDVVRFYALRVKTNGDYSKVDLSISPVSLEPKANSDSTLSTLFLVVLKKSDERQDNINFHTITGGSEIDTIKTVNTEDSDATITQNIIVNLKHELLSKDNYLDAANEELETSNEELKSANEEMQSVNEELQSTNEELETSKEELQSTNEELATVNSELQAKVMDFSIANNDMNNLLAGTGIATIFIDHQLRILRFTPTATKIINLILSDVGRPVGHIASNIKGNMELTQEVQGVLDTLKVKEEQVQTIDNKWYTMRILLYRTLENKIEGAVITFVDITKQKAVDEERLAVEQKYRIIHELSQEAHLVNEVTLYGSDLGFIDCNKAALDMLDISKKELLASNFVSVSPKHQLDGRLSQEIISELILQCISHKKLRFDWLVNKSNSEPLCVDIMMTVYEQRGKMFLYSVWKEAIDPRGSQSKGEEIGS